MMLTLAGLMLTVVLTLKSLGINNVDNVDTFPRIRHSNVKPVFAAGFTLSRRTEPLRRDWPLPFPAGPESLRGWLLRKSLSPTINNARPTA